MNNTNKLKVEGFEPVVGDGLLYVGGEWVHIAPRMEVLALDRLMRENEELRLQLEKAGEYIIQFSKNIRQLTQDMRDIIEPNKASDNDR